MATKDMTLKIKVKGASKAKQDVTGFEGSLKKTIGTAVSLTAAFIAMKKALDISVGLKNAARDAVETNQKFEQVYSSIVKSAHNTSKALQNSFKLATVTAEELLANTGDLLVGFGFAEKKALGLSDRIVRLALDLRSFKNIQMEASEVTQMMVSAMSGNMRAIRSLGVVLRLEDTQLKKIIDTYESKLSMDKKQAVALAVLDEAYDQSYKSIGDFARTQHQLANQERILEERIISLRTEIGERLLPVFSAATGAAILMTDAFSKEFTASFEEISQREIDGITESFLALGSVLGFVANQSVIATNAWNKWGKLVASVVNPTILATTTTWEFIKAISATEKTVNDTKLGFEEYMRLYQPFIDDTNNATEAINFQMIAVRALATEMMILRQIETPDFFIEEPFDWTGILNIEELNGTWKEAMDKFKADTDETTDYTEARWQQAAGIMSNMMYEAFGGNFDNIEDMFKNMLKRMAADLVVSGLLNLLTGGFGMFGGGGLLGGLFTNIGGKIIKAAGGLDDYTVPQGYPNDSFPIMVQSGETVNVTPAGQSPQQDNAKIESLLEEVILTLYKTQTILGDVEMNRINERGGLKRSTT